MRMQLLFMGDHEQLLLTRPADRDVSPFRDGMVRIRNSETQVIAEDGSCFVEGNLVLTQVPCGFLGIPLEFPAASVRSLPAKLPRLPGPV